MSDYRFTVKLHGNDDIVRILKRHPERISRTLLSLTKQEARGLAIELARFTRPFGFAESSKKRGERSVTADIRRVYKPPAEVFEKLKLVDPSLADRFWADVSNRRFARANRDLQDPHSPMSGLTIGRLDPFFHKNSRTGPFHNVPKRQKPQQIATSSDAIDNYITRKLKMVGFAKGSWINAAKAIGGRVRNTAQWCSRHKQAPGTATVKTGNTPSVTLINSLTYIRQVCSESSVQMALTNAAARLKLAFQKSLDYETAKANQKMERRSG